MKKIFIISFLAAIIAVSSCKKDSQQLSNKNTYDECYNISSSILVSTMALRGHQVEVTWAIDGGADNTFLTMITDSSGHTCPTSGNTMIYLCANGHMNNCYVVDQPIIQGQPAIKFILLKSGFKGYMGSVQAFYSGQEWNVNGDVRSCAEQSDSLITIRVNGLPYGNHHMCVQAKIRR